MEYVGTLLEEPVQLQGNRHSSFTETLLLLSYSKDTATSRPEWLSTYNITPSGGKSSKLARHQCDSVLINFRKKNRRVGEGAIERARRLKHNWEGERAYLKSLSPEERKVFKSHLNARKRARNAVQ